MDLEPATDLCQEIYECGMPLIENDFLILGQPLSLPEKIYEQFSFPNAFCGEETLEDLEACKISNDNYFPPSKYNLLSVVQFIYSQTLRETDESLV